MNKIIKALLVVFLTMQNAGYAMSHTKHPNPPQKPLPKLPNKATKSPQEMNEKELAAHLSAPINSPEWKAEQAVAKKAKRKAVVIPGRVVPTESQAIIVKTHAPKAATAHKLNDAEQDSESTESQEYQAEEEQTETKEQESESESEAITSAAMEATQEASRQTEAAFMGNE